MTLLFTLLLLTATADTGPVDSLRTFRLDEVVVTGTRSAVAVRDLPVPVQVLDSAMLEQMNGLSVADKLRHLAGLDVRSYGGLGALQSVSVRGMGSDYALVLVDGVRYTTFQIGTVDLGIFGSNDVERIEIANGGNSALYGADAVGGVVNIITRKPDGRASVGLGLTAGSYGHEGYRLSGGGTISDIVIRASADLLRSPNHYEFTYDDGHRKHPLQRIGADLSSTILTFGARRSFSDAVLSTVTVRYSDVNRGQPAAVTGPVQSSLARINDEDIMIASQTELSFREEGSVTIPLSWRTYRQTYRDPQRIIGGIPLDAYYDNVIVSAAPVYHRSMTQDHHVTAGAELTSASIHSNELVPSRREQLSAFISTRHLFHSVFPLQLYPSVRYDAFSDINGGVSARLGMNIALAEEPVLRLRGSIGRNYRVPTFNDLYWIDGGNPLLQPERSSGSDIGVILGWNSGDIAADLDAGYFRIDTREKIVWLPGAGGRFSPSNIQSVRSSGWEFSGMLSLYQDAVNIRYRHTVLRSVKTSADAPGDASYNRILPYVPQELASVTVSGTAGMMTAAVTYAFSGFRFETADNDPRFFIPSSRTVDANVACRWGSAFGPMAVKFEVNNLFDADRELITGYPLPLRTLSLSYEFTFTSL